ncbi:hypothetical protein ACFL1U_00740 [Patescibacteria group bacterium]
MFFAQIKEPLPIGEAAHKEVYVWWRKYATDGVYFQDVQVGLAFPKGESYHTTEWAIVQEVTNVTF